jgi:hypothetical protein
MAQWVLLETSVWVNIQRITGVAHCANVVWLDLAPRDERVVGVYVSVVMQRLICESPELLHRPLTPATGKMSESPGGGDWR